MLDAVYIRPHFERLVNYAVMLIYLRTGSAVIHRKEWCSRVNVASSRISDDAELADRMYILIMSVLDVVCLSDTVYCIRYYFRDSASLIKKLVVCVPVKIKE